MGSQPTVCNFGWKARDFDLPATDGKRYTLKNAAGPNGLLVMFICNHCPYVKAIRERLIRDCAELKTLGVNAVAINSNDPDDYPEDSFENMQRVARDLKFAFPYLFDETQEVAHAYDAVCTPDFFGYNAKLELQYRGRLDASGRSADAHAPRELFNAMIQIARTGEGPREQMTAIGCSIKWRDGA